MDILNLTGSDELNVIDPLSIPKELEDSKKTFHEILVSLVSGRHEGGRARDEQVNELMHMHADLFKHMPCDAGSELLIEFEQYTRDNPSIPGETLYQDFNGNNESGEGELSEIHLIDNFVVHTYTSCPSYCDDEYDVHATFTIKMYPSSEIARQIAVKDAEKYLKVDLSNKTSDIENIYNSLKFYLSPDELAKLEQGISLIRSLN